MGELGIWISSSHWLNLPLATSVPFHLHLPYLLLSRSPHKWHDRSGESREMIDCWCSTSRSDSFSLVHVSQVRARPSLLLPLSNALTLTYLTASHSFTSPRWEQGRSIIATNVRFHLHKYRKTTARLQPSQHRICCYQCFKQSSPPVCAIISTSLQPAVSTYYSEPSRYQKTCCQYPTSWHKFVHFYDNCLECSLFQFILQWHLTNPRRYRLL